MMTCPNCGTVCKSKSQIRNETRQWGRSMDYGEKLLEHLSIEVDREALKEAINTLFEDGYYARKRASQSIAGMEVSTE